MKILFIFTFLIFTIPGPVYAHDDVGGWDFDNYMNNLESNIDSLIRRIDDLERIVGDLERNVVDLESDNEQLKKVVRDKLNGHIY